MPTVCGKAMLFRQASILRGSAADLQAPALGVRKSYAFPASLN